MLIVEKWVDIKGYEGLYKLSNLGKIYAYPKLVRGTYRPEAILLKHIGTHGYAVIFLSKRGVKTHFYIHHLVAKYFVENPDNLPEINHEDLDKSNCAFWNLTWTTHKGNMEHALKNGVLSGRTNIKKAKKINIEVATEIRTAYNDGVSSTEIAKMFKLNQSTISRIINFKIWI